MSGARAVFVDKDGTLVENVPYNVDPARTVFASGVPQGAALLARNGWRLVVVSNQSGVARGFFEATELDRMRAHLDALLEASGAHLDGFYCCPHHPDGVVEGYAIACACRKPAPGLLVRAATELDIDLASSWMVGDILDDIEAGHAAGVRSILVDCGNETEWRGGTLRQPDVTVRDFSEAARFIVRDGVRRKGAGLMELGVTTSVGATLERFRSLRALVLGDAMLDSYLTGTATRLGREAPVPIVDLDGRIDAPGGAANAAANVQALGARVTFLSAVGADEAGDRLVAALAARGVGGEDVLHVRERETLTKQRVVADGQVLLRFDTGSSTALDDVSEERLVSRLRPRFVDADLVLVSDYEYGVLTPRVVDVLASLQSSAPRVVVIDARNPERFRSIGATAAKPNHEEAWRLLGRTAPASTETDRAARLLEVRDELFARTGVEVLAVTMDLDGALVMDRAGGTHRTFATPTSSARTAGAGDTFAAALGLALAAGADLATASEVASAAGAVAVSRDGTSVCDLDELRAALSGRAKYLEGLEALRGAVHAHRRAGRRVVFTNGCFDLVHRGHVAYLAEAKALGDVLVVGLNSDESTRRLKGPGRPLNCLEDRAQVLAALSSVDHVVPFEEDTPAELIRAIAPDIVVKGGDYTRDSLPEAPLVEALGGEVRILGYLDDHSTTGLIDRARRMRASRARRSNGASA